jgi:7-carboxy-7-deazaguanine synthase
MYTVKEIFYSLQGEGARAGRPAVFCRFAGCNLWNGRESDRQEAICSFCDTDFMGSDGLGGGKFRDPHHLAKTLAQYWPEEQGKRRPYLVFTGGEPLLQLDASLLDAVHQQGFEVAIETNGTRLPPAGVDWVCVSPKAGSDWILKQGNELKLVYPQSGLMPECCQSAEFDMFYLQPMDDGRQAQHTQDCVAYCLDHPLWNLSLQNHKLLKIR